jgi:hypothetical protein
VAKKDFLEWTQPNVNHPENRSNPKTYLYFGVNPFNEFAILFSKNSFVLLLFWQKIFVLNPQNETYKIGSHKVKTNPHFLYLCSFKN